MRVQRAAAVFAFGFLLFGATAAAWPQKAAQKASLFGSNSFLRHRCVVGCGCEPACGKTDCGCEAEVKGCDTKGCGICGKDAAGPCASQPNCLARVACRLNVAIRNLFICRRQCDCDVCSQGDCGVEPDCGCGKVDLSLPIQKEGPDQKATGADPFEDDDAPTPPPPPEVDRPASHTRTTAISASTSKSMSAKKPGPATAPPAKKPTPINKPMIERDTTASAHPAPQASLVERLTAAIAY